LLVQEAHVSDLPSLGDLAAVKVADDSLVHAKGSAAPWDAGEVSAECPRHDDPCHFHVPLGQDLLNLVAKVGHGCHGLTPHLLLCIEALGREPPRSMDHDVITQEVVECVDITSVTGVQPAGNDGRRLLHASLSRTRCPLASSPTEPPSSVGPSCRDGYLLQDIAGSRKPSPPHLERKHSYQYYLHNERGRTGLREYRSELARLLWQEWSPTWRFTEEEFEADPAYGDTERRIAAQPSITVPTIVIDGEHDTVTPARPRDTHEQHFFAG